MRFGWKQRYMTTAKPPFLPACLESPWWGGWNATPGEGETLRTSSGRPFALRGIPAFLPVFLCFALAYGLSLAARLLEVPFWYNPEYLLGDEFLLATHDAYHWIAGAEGFEFGAGHPMSVFLAALSNLSGMSPANLGFWLPPYIGSLLAVAVCLWGWGLGRPYAGLCAGVLASLSPAFFGRTQLGFYDTDLVVLLFVVLIGLVPALWLHPWLKTLPDMAAEAVVGWKNRRDLGAERGGRGMKGASRISPTVSQDGPVTTLLDRMGGALRKRAFAPVLSRGVMEEAMLAWPWLLALALSGLFGHWAQQLHSFFPYYIRFSALLIPLLILVGGPLQGRNILLRGALCHAFPLLLGSPGFVLALLLGLVFRLPSFVGAAGANGTDGFPVKERTKAAGAALFMRRLVLDNRFLLALWLLVLALCVDASVLKLMRDSYLSYAHRGGDIAAGVAGAGVADPLVFPSVAESILETQTLEIRGLLLYFYPDNLIVALSILAVVLRLVKTPVLAWFLPLLGLFFLSRSMGARMAMFGPPALALCLCLEGGQLLEKAFAGLRRLVAGAFPSVFPQNFSKGRINTALRPYAVLIVAMGVTVYLVWPLTMLIPGQSRNGPIISKEHAAALSHIKENSPADSIVWDWWDWGYAAHHFARRVTVADGARHGGPSLYLPAAVYTTADPRFARQVIKYTALKNNVPGNVFAGLTATEAQRLMVDLGDKNAPLIQAPGSQYLVVSYDLLPIGAWVSNYGSWNFAKKKMHPSLLSDISQGEVNFNSETGVILYNSEQFRRTLQAGSVAVFSPGELQRYTYRPRDSSVPPFSNHFIFDVKKRAITVPEPLQTTWAYRFWESRMGKVYLSSAVTNKLLMDPVFYHTMMVQLLVGKRNDPRFAPYFKCVFDNVYSRVYQVL